MPLLPGAGGELRPSKVDLLTQLGGTVAFRGTELVHTYADSGVLKYTDVDALLAAVLDPVQRPQASSSATLDMKTTATPAATAASDRADTIT
jgi:hypothetical protein